MKVRFSMRPKTFINTPLFAPIMDQDVLSLLKQTEFSCHELEGVRAYYNKADAPRQALMLTFSALYDSPKEAQEAEIAIDFFLHAAQKGTPQYPTEDAIARAFLEKRVHPPRLYTNRNKNCVTFVISSLLPAGTSTGLVALDYSKEILEDLFYHPLALEDDSIFAKAQQETLDEIAERISDHDKMAAYHFFRKYFSEEVPLSIEEERERVQQATMEALVEQFTAHLQRSFSVALFSGSMPQRVALTMMQIAAKKYGGSGTEDVLKKQSYQPMSISEEQYHQEGPSEKMQLFQAYALREIPQNLKDKAALRVLNQVLGADWNSLLMQIIREKHHLVYGIYSEYSSLRNMMMITTSHNPQDYQRIVDLTAEIVSDIVKGTITKEQFEHAQERLLESTLVQGGSFSGGIKTCDQPQFRIASAYNLYVSGLHEESRLDEWKQIAALKHSDVQDAAERFLDSKNRQIFTYGQVKS